MRAWPSKSRVPLVPGKRRPQRLGRILRPKSDGSPATFYTLVTAGSREQTFAQRRQLFLAEQGYSYQIIEDFTDGKGSNGSLAKN